MSSGTVREDILRRDSFRIVEIKTSIAIIAVREVKQIDTVVALGVAPLHENGEKT